MLTPSAKGQPKKYGIGGWALGINNDIDPKKQEAAWVFIKWLTSPAVHKDLNLRGAGSYLRKSELTDPDLLAKYPFLPVIATCSSTATATFARAFRNIRNCRI